MRNLLLLAAFVLFAAPLQAQNTATVTQDGDNQGAAVTQGGTSNEAYVDQYSDNTGPQQSTVLQTGSSNYAEVDMSQTGGGGHSVANTAYLAQVGVGNAMWQSLNAPGYNAGQHAQAEQEGDENQGWQTVYRGYTMSLGLVQDGDGNTASQEAMGGGHDSGSVGQDGSGNMASQYIADTNARADIDQVGDDNEAYQTAQGGGFSIRNDAIIDQNGNGNYASQFGDGHGFYLRIRQDGDGNWADTHSSGGPDNYINVVMSGGATLNVVQLGSTNALMGLGGAGTEGLVLNGSTLTLTQTGDMNDAFVDLQSGGLAAVSQDGTTNSSTVIQN